MGIGYTAALMVAMSIYHMVDNACVMLEMRMSERRDEIMDAAEHMIRTAGYNGFSFREIADEVGVKSASVHYHFPTKADLASAVAKRYREKFSAALAEKTEAGAAPLTVWRDLFREALQQDGLMCLCGILAAEGDNLPPEVADEARKFLEDGIQLIAEIEGKGPSDGARILAQLEGAMLLARSIGDPTVFDRATDSLG